jgi:hypothetical protein
MTGQLPCVRLPGERAAEPAAGGEADLQPAGPAAQPGHLLHGRADHLPVRQPGQAHRYRSSYWEHFSPVASWPADRTSTR